MKIVMSRLDKSSLLNLLSLFALLFLTSFLLSCHSVEWIMLCKNCRYHCSLVWCTCTSHCGFIFFILFMHIASQGSHQGVITRPTYHILWFFMAWKKNILLFYCFYHYFFHLNHHYHYDSYNKIWNPFSYWNFKVWVSKWCPIDLVLDSLVTKH